MVKMIKMEERIDRDEFRKTTNLYYFLKPGEVMTIGEMFYYGCKFLISDKIAEEVMEKVVLPSENSKMKEKKIINILNQIDAVDIDKLKIFMAYNLIATKHRNIFMTYHAMVKILTRFVKRDVALIREKLNAAIEIYLKKGKTEILIWNTIFIIKDNMVVTCFYPTEVTKKCIKYNIQSGLNENNSIIKTLDKLKKMEKIKNIKKECIRC